MLVSFGKTQFQHCTAYTNDTNEHVRAPGRGASMPQGYAHDVVDIQGPVGYYGQEDNSEALEERGTLEESIHDEKQGIDAMV